MSRLFRLAVLGLVSIATSCSTASPASFSADPASCENLDFSALKAEVRDACLDGQQDGQIPSSEGKVVLIDTTRDQETRGEVLLVQAESSIESASGDDLVAFSVSETLGLVRFAPTDLATPVRWQLKLVDGSTFPCSHDSRMNNLRCS